MIDLKIKNILNISTSVWGKKRQDYNVTVTTFYHFLLRYITIYIILLDIYNVHVTGMIVKQLSFVLFQEQHVGGFVWGLC